jgi:uncharacterized membrane protein
MFLYFYVGITISAAGWSCIVATGILHTFYFFFVGSSYEQGDLSVVYPLARGFGPFWVPILAVVILGERLSLPGIIGIALVVAGIYAIHLKSFSFKALLTGCTIAAYSLVDKMGVKSVHPAVYIYFIFLIPLIFLTPYVLIKERRALKPEWQINKGPIMVVGFLVAFTYLLVLFAMQTSNVSYVVAVREVSIVFSKPSAAQIDRRFSDCARGRFYRFKPIGGCEPVFHDCRKYLQRHRKVFFTT